MQIQTKHKTYTESELIDGCLKNNRIVQKALYDHYCKRMFTLAYRMLSNWDLAHDVLQDAFIEVFKSIHQVRQEAFLGSWIRKIVVRSAINKIRERQRLTFEHCTEPETSTQIDDTFTAEQLENAIKTLPEGNRMVFVLIEIEGYKHKEVAEMMNISEGTSKSQLHYAKKLLRMKLIEYQND